jgi:hypothetical protein
MKTLPNHGYVITDRNGSVVAWFADFLHATDFGTANGPRLGLTQHYLGDDAIPAQETPEVSHEKRLIGELSRALAEVLDICEYDCPTTQEARELLASMPNPMMSDAPATPARDMPSRDS